jgi:hypothetical protein
MDHAAQFLLPMLTATMEACCRFPSEPFTVDVIGEILKGAGVVLASRSASRLSQNQICLGKDLIERIDLFLQDFASAVDPRFDCLDRNPEDICDFGLGQVL